MHIGVVHNAAIDYTFHQFGNNACHTQMHAYNSFLLAFTKASYFNQQIHRIVFENFNRLQKVHSTNFSTNFTYQPTFRCELWTNSHRNQ